MAPKRSDEFRHEAVRITLTSGLTRKQVASDLGIGFFTLSKWIQKSSSDNFPPTLDLDLAKENDRLRKILSSQGGAGFAKKGHGVLHPSLSECFAFTCWMPCQ